MPRRRRSAGNWAALATGPGLVLAGVLTMVGATTPPGDVGSVPSGAVHGVPDRRGTPALDPPIRVPSAGIRPPAPVRLELPRFAINARIEPVGVAADGALGIPENPHVLGWWRSGARPGEGRGAVVVDGHVDSARHGLGVFVKLAELEPGDAVGIAAAHGKSRRYVVSGRRLYPKASLPASEIFSQQGPERLVLISCGGTFDKRLRTYSHNVVVYAVPVPQQAKGPAGDH